MIVYVRAFLLLLLVVGLSLAVGACVRGEPLHSEVPLNRPDVDLILPAPGGGGAGEHWNPL